MRNGMIDGDLDGKFDMTVYYNQGKRVRDEKARQHHLIDDARERRARRELEIFRPDDLVTRKKLRPNGVDGRDVIAEPDGDVRRRRNDAIVGARELLIDVLAPRQSNRIATAILREIEIERAGKIVESACAGTHLARRKIRRVVTHGALRLAFRQQQRRNPQHHDDHDRQRRNPFHRVTILESSPRRIPWPQTRSTRC